MKNVKYDEETLAKYVQCFEWVDQELAEQGKVLVERKSTDQSHLDEVYSKTKGPLPKLYEKLLLSYRWYRAELDEYHLLANPPGDDFSGILSEIFNDKYLSSVSLKGGYIQFAFAPSYNYDPVCFDTNGKKADHWPIVQLDHEEILIRSRLRKKRVLAENFRELVLKTISKTVKNSG